MSIQFSTNDGGRTYKGLTTDHVYEIVAQGNGAHWASWLLRVRELTSLAGHQPQWREIGTYKNPATAEAYARYEEENQP